MSTYHLRSFFTAWFCYLALQEVFTGKQLIACGAHHVIKLIEVVSFGAVLLVVQPGSDASGGNGRTLESVVLGVAATLASVVGDSIAFTGLADRIAESSPLGQ